MSTRDFLVELGTEELPPKALTTLAGSFREGIVKGLDQAGLTHGEVHSYAAPRRLAVLVKALATQQHQCAHRQSRLQVGSQFAEEGRRERERIAINQIGWVLRLIQEMMITMDIFLL